MRRIQALALLVDNDGKALEILECGTKSAALKAAREKALGDLKGNHVEVITGTRGRVYISNGGRQAMMEARREAGEKSKPAPAKKKRGPGRPRKNPPPEESETST